MNTAIVSAVFARLGRGMVKWPIKSSGELHWPSAPVRPAASRCHPGSFLRLPSRGRCGLARSAPLQDPKVSVLPPVVQGNLWIRLLTASVVPFPPVSWGRRPPFRDLPPVLVSPGSSGEVTLKRLPAPCPHTGLSFSACPCESLISGVPYPPCRAQVRPRCLQGLLCSGPRPCRCWLHITLPTLVACLPSVGCRAEVGWGPQWAAWRLLFAVAVLGGGCLFKVSPWKEF